jgi:predicted DNA-binding protein
MRSFLCGPSLPLAPVRSPLYVSEVGLRRARRWRACDLRPLWAAPGFGKTDSVSVTIKKTHLPIVDIMYIICELEEMVMSTQMIIRLDPDFKDKVSRLARAEGKTTAQVVRELLERYVRERDLGAYIDQVWSRIGDKLRRAGASVKDVDRAIAQVRKSR